MYVCMHRCMHVTSKCTILFHRFCHTHTYAQIRAHIPIQKAQTLLLLKNQQKKTGKFTQQTPSCSMLLNKTKNSVFKIKLCSTYRPALQSSFYAPFSHVTCHPFTISIYKKKNYIQTQCMSRSACLYMCMRELHISI